MTNMLDQCQQFILYKICISLMLLFTSCIGGSLIAHHKGAENLEILNEGLEQLKSDLERIEDTVNEIKEISLKSLEYLQKLLYEDGLKLIEAEYEVLMEQDQEFQIKFLEQLDARLHSFESQSRKALVSVLLQ